MTRAAYYTLDEQGEPVAVPSSREGHLAWAKSQEGQETFSQFGHLLPPKKKRK
jgi:hypothetical protein